MFQNLSIFKMAHAMATHAGTRQAVVAQNVANADTPGYAARDITPFHDLVSSGPRVAGQVATRDGHLHGQMSGAQADVFNRDGALSDPNGNSVSLELEMLHSVATKRQHDRALAIYKSSMTILRTSLGKR